MNLRDFRESQSPHWRHLPEDIRWNLSPRPAVESPAFVERDPIEDPSEDFGPIQRSTADQQRPYSTTEGSGDFNTSQNIISLNDSSGLEFLSFRTRGVTCPIHGEVNYVTFREDSTLSESYCLNCVRELFKKFITPLDDGGGLKLPSDKPLYSRYDIIKKENKHV